MEIGDLIYCHTTGYMQLSGRVHAYAGKEYTVVKILRNDRIIIHSELDINHVWPINSVFWEHFSIKKRITHDFLKKRKTHLEPWRFNFIEQGKVYS